MKMGRPSMPFSINTELNFHEMVKMPSSGWENSKIDTTKYRESITHIWRVSPEWYEYLKEEGVLCMKYKEAYYVAM